MKKMLFLVLLALPLITLASDVSVTAVEAHQRYPWNGLVDITVTLQGATEDVAEATCLFAATNSATKAALPVAHITQNGAYSSSEGAWSRKFIWDTNADLGEVKIDDVALTVDVKMLGGVQLWEGGSYWAECNIGATKPEEYGYYFWWGDTIGYKLTAVGYGWESVKDGSSFSFSSDNCPTYGKSNSQLQSAGYIDAGGNLVAAHDAATAYRGAPWHMPTEAEFATLLNNCDATWTTYNGVKGQLITGRGVYSSKSIFLPAVGYGRNSRLESPDLYGYCWSSTPHSDYSDSAWYLAFRSDIINWYYSYRYFGLAVRPVRGFAPSVEDVRKFPKINAFTASGRNPIDGRLDFCLAISAEEWPKNVVTLSFNAVDNVGSTNLVVNTLVYDDGQSATISAPGNYHVVWDAPVDLGRVALSSVTITAMLSESGGANLTALCETSATVDTMCQGELGGVQLWENGPYWAECNVGAEKPEDYGYCFWWGDTVGYKRNAADDGWVSVKNGSLFSFNSENCPTYVKLNSELQSMHYIDSTGNLTATHDAAAAHLGAPWRMPSAAEFAALISNCTTTWETYNGVKGRRVTGKGEYSSKSIFLPSDGIYGFYWSSTTDSESQTHAWNLLFDSHDFNRNRSIRYFGHPVRPLRGFAQ